VLASHGGYTFYKVALSGYATSVNIASACEAAGLLTPCPCSSAFASHAGFNDAVGGKSCVVTSEIGCGNPMGTTARASGCPSFRGWETYYGGDVAEVRKCAAFDGVFTYTGSWGSGAGCGSVSGSWCVYGSSYAGYYAMCAAKI
jgi:hypothetical protein